VIGVCRP